MPCEHASGPERTSVVMIVGTPVSDGAWLNPRSSRSLSLGMTAVSEMACAVVPVLLMTTHSLLRLGHTPPRGVSLTDTRRSTSVAWWDGIKVSLNTV